MSARDRAITRGLLEWFTAHQRDLPWRRTLSGSVLRDPYRVLVSEVMLQQTQVSRVLGKYEEFLRRFPDVRALAQASEQEVLSAWTGLGYYRRARLLHRCAQHVVTRYAGVIPRRVEDLRSLPGVGAYSAGAVASLAYGAREAAVDANVTRVLLRIEGTAYERSSKQAQSWAWQRSRRLMTHARGAAAAGKWNEALMELGATVCKPRAPECGRCPLRKQCVGYRQGTAASIPGSRRSRARGVLTHACIVARDKRGRVLLEQRADTGLWAGMWQAPTIELEGTPPRSLRPQEVAQRLSMSQAGLVLRERFLFKTTHRDVWFVVYDAPTTTSARATRRPLQRWVAQGRIGEMPMSSPQRRVLGLSRRKEPR